MVSFKLLNLLVAFVVELFMLAALSYWGFHHRSSETVKFALGIGVPIAIGGIWGLLIAPNSPRRLPLPWSVLLELIIFAIAGAALFQTGHHTSAAILTGVAVASLALGEIWHQ